MEPLGLLLFLRSLARGRLRLAWRYVKILLGLRRITPRLGEEAPFQLVEIPPLPRDTSGPYRPKHRPQDPAKDPREPYGGESSSRGTDHGWANCTQSSGATALAYQTQGGAAPWGGDLRHAQGDLDGGTDLYDLRTAWAAYGETLTIKSGSGWGALVDAHEAGRPIVIQGEGNVPGSGTFTGGHACCIGIETRASDGAWLWGDPCVSDWQWVPPSKIRSWAEAWQSSIAYAVGKPLSSSPPPPDDPDCPDCPDCPPAPAPFDCGPVVDQAVTAAGDALVRSWLDWLRAPRPTPADIWDAGSWADPSLQLEETIDEGTEPDPCIDELTPAAWGRGPLPFPVSSALAVLYIPAAWASSGWAGGAWRS